MLLSFFCSGFSFFRSLSGIKQLVVFVVLYLFSFFMFTSSLFILFFLYFFLSFFLSVFFCVLVFFLISFFLSLFLFVLSLFLSFFLSLFRSLYLFLCFSLVEKFNFFGAYLFFLMPIPPEDLRRTQPRSPGLQKPPAARPPHGAVASSSLAGVRLPQPPRLPSRPRPRFAAAAAAATATATARARASASASDTTTTTTTTTTATTMRL